LSDPIRPAIREQRRYDTLTYKVHVVVTGAAGLVGRRVVEALSVQSGWRITQVGRRQEHDVTRPQWWRSVPGLNAGADVVLHLAGRTFVPDSWKQPAAFYDNVSMAVQALEFCRETGARLVYVSAYLYGRPEYLPIDESHPVTPDNPYAHSKHLAEQLCAFYASHFNVNVAVLRPFNLYGPGQDDRFLIPTIVKQALRGGVVTLRDTRPKRDYLYIDDFVDALVCVMRKDQRGTAVYNVGSGRSVSVKEIADEIGRAFGRDLTIEDLGERRQNEIDDCVADTRRFRESYDWTPHWTLERGIKEVVSLAERGSL
jgi:nucleoside-diphosphate-sugar epimerase